MKSQLEKLKGQIEALVSRAEELSDSENEKTAQKYQDIPIHLEAALDAIEEAIQELE